MVGRTIAARSLRHLRFARRMMAGQPLLARAAERLDGYRSRYLPAYISLDGHQLSVGRVLRRLPQREEAWTTGADDARVDDGAIPGEPLANDFASDEAIPASETLLRLLPRLSEPETPPAVDTHDEPPVSVPTRPNGRRPRSRIVELPGVVSLPVEDEADHDDSPPAVDSDAQTDAQTDVVAAAGGTDAQAGDQEAPLPAIDVGELPQTSEEVAPPAPAPRRHGSKRDSKRDSRHGAQSSPRPSDALFPPTDADRSPQTWLARLRGEEKPASPAPPAPPTLKPADETSAPPSIEAPHPGEMRRGGGGPTPQAAATAQPLARPLASPPTAVERPATLSDSSRTLLQTMTGVDPADAPIYRGSVAERVTAAQNADALTDGRTIALGAGHATDAPETIGLIAHELTHVAQRRSPRFAPPIALPQRSEQTASLRGGAADLTPDLRPPSLSAGAGGDVGTSLTPSLADEEAQAAQVEARVTRMASARRSSLLAPANPQAPSSEQPTPKAQPPRELPTQPDIPPGVRPVWGNLPAPWEPLPDWLSGTVDAPESVPQQPGQPAPPAPARAPSSDAPGASGAPGIQRAERGRSLPSVESEAPMEASQAMQAHQEAMPEPDLDALAQQVHAILKRRLAAERRRFG